MRRAPHLSDEINDIQALLGSGFGWLTSSCYWLLTINDVVLAHQWLARLEASGLVRSVGDLKSFKAGWKQQVKEVTAIAFSFSGLRTLGITESSTFPFPTPFRSGMGSALRETLLRDEPRADWSWADCERDVGQEVHILLATWWDASTPPTLQAPDRNAFSMQMIDGSPSYFQGNKLFEPFGFRDGISQPVIRGLREDAGASAPQAELDAGPLYLDRVVAPGEFILGYRNEYDELAHCPDVEGWNPGDAGAYPGAPFGLNGSFLAVRQIEQNVVEFAKLNTPSLAAPALPTGVTVAEKLVGRRRDEHGTPLGWQRPACPVSDSEADAFRYRVADQEGFLCPRGAHVRRVNPRDSLGHDVASGVTASKLHRLLRRGRPYRAIRNCRPQEGLFFIACNADLERQFEFIHQRWLRNPRFACLDGEDDPILGDKRNSATFSMPAQPIGDAVTLASFTTTLGGGYFFLPGLKALKFIVSLRMVP